MTSQFIYYVIGSTDRLSVKMKMTFLLLIGYVAMAYTTGFRQKIVADRS